MNMGEDQALSPMGARQSSFGSNLEPLA